MNLTILQSNIPNAFGAIKNVTHTGVPEESAPLIEEVIDPELANRIYRSELVKEWFAGNQIEVLDFGGGEVGISLPMLLAIPLDVLKQIVINNDTGRRMGKIRAEKVLQDAMEAMAQEPYY